MADDRGSEKSLEMRVAELEDKLKGLHITEEEMTAYNKVASLMGGGQGGAGAQALAAQPDAAVLAQCIRACVIHQCIRSCVIHQCIRACVIHQCIRACIIQDCINECGGGCAPGGAGGIGGGGFGSLGG